MIDDEAAVPWFIKEYDHTEDPKLPVAVTRRPSHPARTVTVETTTVTVTTVTTVTVKS
ncbi:hypothetical protein [Streptomyces uncialis]|uniref:hypothetical protein n=1 Tax=Streptomyces uncialis TaxID=1048205 RepID=UPI0033F120EB